MLNFTSTRIIRNITYYAMSELVNYQTDQNSHCIEDDIHIARGKHQTDDD